MDTVLTAPHRRTQYIRLQEARQRLQADAGALSDHTFFLELLSLLSKAETRPATARMAFSVQWRNLGRQTILPC